VRRRSVPLPWAGVAERVSAKRSATPGVGRAIGGARPPGRGAGSGPEQDKHGDQLGGREREADDFSLPDPRDDDRADYVTARTSAAGLVNNPDDQKQAAHQLDQRDHDHECLRGGQPVGLERGRRLEITAGAPKYTRRSAGIWSTNDLMRKAELELARQAETSYKRMVQDQQAGGPAKKEGASVTLERA
jgi:hypothetical protein